MMNSKYGIEIDANSKILNLRFFDEDDFPKEYIEITEFQYMNFVKERKPWSKFIGGAIVNESADEQAYLLNMNIYKLRVELEDLFVKIGLAKEMNEDTTNLVQEFDRFKNIYKNLTQN